MRRTLSILTVILSILAFVQVSHAQTTKPAGTLVSVKAVYGDLPDGDKTDVTEKIKAMVKDNALTVDATNDNFDDPAVGTAKKLKVDYTIDGAAHSRTIAESETMIISTKPSKLVITKALYGDLPDGDKTDVTAIVRDQISGDQLKIKASNDNFGDPASGITKKLQVEYKLNGVVGVKTVNEDEDMTISSDDK